MLLVWLVWLDWGVGGVSATCAVFSIYFHLCGRQMEWWLFKVVWAFSTGIFGLLAAVQIPMLFFLLFLLQHLPLLPLLSPFCS